MTTENLSRFDDFTGKYKILKTLRFELKPVGKTEDFLKKNKVIEKDQTIDDSYNQAKFYFDVLHQRFIDAALNSEKVKHFSLQNFARVLCEKNRIISENKREISELRNVKNDKQIEGLQREINNAEGEIEKERKELYKKVRVFFDKEAEQWKKDYQEKEIDGKKIAFSKNDLKQNGVDFLTAAGILNVLKYEFPEAKEMEFKKKEYPSLYVDVKENPEKKRYIFESFNKFSGYLRKFQETRKNLYAIDGTSTAVATRITDNFVIFFQNKKIFDDKYKDNHSSINFDKIGIFEIEHYTNCFLQKGIEGSEGEQGSENSYNKIVSRINQQIKEYRDQKAREKDFKKSDYPFFKTLDKQILGKIEKEEELIKKTEEESEEEVLVGRFKKFIENNEICFRKAKELMKSFFTGEFEGGYTIIYLKKAAINTISRRWFANDRDFELKLPQQKSGSKTERDEPKIKKFISVSEVKNAVEQFEGDVFKADLYDKMVIRREQGGTDRWQQFLSIWKYEFEDLFKDTTKENGEKILGYDSYLEEAKRLQAFSGKKEEVAVIKNYADSALGIFQMLKYFTLDDKDRKNAPGQISADFYEQYDEYYKDFEFIKYYNAFRNFITKKPFDERLIKLNFDKGNLLGGWAESSKGKAQFGGYILRKSSRYYLAISKHTTFLKIDEDHLSVEAGGEYYEKLKYSSLDWGKNIAGGQVYPSYTKKECGESVSYQEHKKQLRPREHVDFVKKLIREKYISKFPKLEEFLSADYDSVKDMQDAFSNLRLGGISFAKIKATRVENQEIKDKNRTHQLFLFEILNRDLRDRSKITHKNMHTLYWDALFSDKNLSEVTFNLLGNAEIFFRKATKDLPIRKNEKGEEYINKDGKKIVENRRYSRDLIKFHIPIALNVSKKGMTQGRFNKMLNGQILAKNRDVNIIGIDRGEKHLLYYSVVNQGGKILEQGSLNEVNGVNYHEKLFEREKERILNRQSWQPVAKIKDLKEGYISHVIHKICELIEKHNAIVVLEDLNMRFKQIRSGIERSVYQQFEKALIDKLGYMVFKDDRNLRAPGGVLNGYQLAAPFVSFEKMGKQTGIIFYTQANYTSVTDPLTGFRKNIYISNSASQDKMKEALGKLKGIGWDDTEQSYFFKYNPIDFVEEKYKNNTFSKEWVVYAKAPRIRRERGEAGYWSYEQIDLNKKFKGLFNLWNFDDPQKRDMQEEIMRKEAERKLQGKKEFDGKSKNFYESFVYLFNLVLQLRNSFSLQIKQGQDGKIKEIKEGVDFIASPVRPFFATEARSQGKVLLSANFAGFEKRFIGSEEDRKKFLEEFNGDANGAYNIARKGAMILERIQKNPENPDRYITNAQWDGAIAKWAKEALE